MPPTAKATRAPRLPPAIVTLRENQNAATARAARAFPPDHGGFKPSGAFPRHCTAPARQTKPRRKAPARGDGAGAAIERDFLRVENLLPLRASRLARRASEGQPPATGPHGLPRPAPSPEKKTARRPASVKARASSRPSAFRAPVFAKNSARADQSPPGHRQQSCHPPRPPVTIRPQARRSTGEDRKESSPGRDARA